MRRLAEEETIAHLWDGEHGVMRRCAEAFADAERVTKKAEAKAREAVRNEPFEQTSLPAGVTPGACVAARLRDALRAAGTAGALLNVSTSHFPLPRSYIKFSKNLPLLR